VCYADTMTVLSILIGCILFCEVVGAVSGIVTIKSVTTWYRKLKKPSFNPPSSVFGPVWTTLYALIGISLFLIIQSQGEKELAYIFFGVQLVLNFLWSFIFFKFHKIGWALIEILLLLVSIVLTIIYFSQINIFAAILFIPYFLWVAFASLLNASIWKLNK